MSLDAVAHLVIAHGYGLVFLAFCLDCVGLPVPGELLLITFGALAMKGHFAPALGIAVAAAGVLTGDSISYWLCRTRAPRVLARLRFGRTINGKTIVLGRFVVGARMALAPMAGARRHPFARFVAFDAIGATCWATTFVLIGYIGGRDLAAVQQHLSSAMSLMQAALIAAVATYFVTRMRRTARVAGAAAASLLVVALGPATALGVMTATRGGASAYARAAFTRDGVNAMVRSRAPVATKIAFAMAAGTGRAAGSPPPSGTSGVVRIG